MDLCLVDFAFNSTYNLIGDYADYKEVQLEYYLSRTISFFFLLIIGFRTLVVPFDVYSGFESQNEIVKEVIRERLKPDLVHNIPEVRLLNPLFKAKIFLITFLLVVWQNTPWSCLLSISIINLLHFGFAFALWTKYKPFRTVFDFISAVLFELVIHLFLGICLIIEFSNEAETTIVIMLQEITAFLALCSIAIEFFRFLVTTINTFYNMIKTRKLNLKTHSKRVLPSSRARGVVAPRVEIMPAVDSRGNRTLLQILKAKRYPKVMSLYNKKKKKKELKKLN